MAARAGQEGLVAVGAAAAVVAVAVVAVDQEEVAAEAVIDNYVVVMVQTVIFSHFFNIVYLQRILLSKIFLIFCNFTLGCALTRQKK